MSAASCDGRRFTRRTILAIDLRRPVARETEVARHEYLQPVTLDREHHGRALAAADSRGEDLGAACHGVHVRRIRKG